MAHQIRDLIGVACFKQIPGPGLVHGNTSRPQCRHCLVKGLGIMGIGGKRMDVEVKPFQDMFGTCPPERGELIAVLDGRRFFQALAGGDITVKRDL
jgi:hypothetical protein